MRRPFEFYLVFLAMVEAIASFSQRSIPYQSARMNQGSYQQQQQQPKCELISEGICKDMFYEYTKMPNMFGHQTQIEANREANEYYSLVQINCSEDFLLLICTTHLPICLQDFDGAIPPCRSVCTKARDSCLPIMKQYKLPWPQKLNCDRFPEQNGVKNVLCAERNSSSSQETSSEESAPFSRHIPNNSITEKVNEFNPLPPKKFIDSSSSVSSAQDLAKTIFAEQNLQVERLKQINRKASETLENLFFESNSTINNKDFKQLKTTKSRLHCNCDCRGPLRKISSVNKDAFSKANIGGIEGCSQSCHSAYFAENDYKYIEFRIAFCGILCIVSTMAIILTFFTDTKRFQYPERPIIYFAISYLLVSIGLIIRFSLGHENVACNQNELNYSLNGQPVCAVVFILTYFFTNCASAWWMVFSIIWCLSAALKWSSEAICKYAQAFHAIAWLLPSIQTALVLMLGASEGDPLTGLCTISNSNLSNTIGFIIIPQIIYLIVGIVCLVIGFICLFKVQRSIKMQTMISMKVDKMENLMTRIGILAALYIIPNVVYLSILNWERINKTTWELGLICKCDWISGIDGNILKPYEFQKPDFTIMMLKIVMNIMPGITCSFWIWSHKTVSSWRNVLLRLCCRSSTTNLNSQVLEERMKMAALTRESIGSKYIGACSTESPWSGHANTQRSDLISSPNAQNKTAIPLPPIPSYKDIQKNGNYFDSQNGYLSPNNEESRYLPNTLGLGDSVYQGQNFGTTTTISGGYYQLPTACGVMTSGASHSSTTSTAASPPSNYSKVSNYKNFPNLL